MANAVRDNPERAEFVGCGRRWARYISFCAAPVGEPWAGLFAVNYEILTAENMGLGPASWVLLMAPMGDEHFVGPSSQGPSCSPSSGGCSATTPGCHSLPRWCCWPPCSSCLGWRGTGPAGLGQLVAERPGSLVGPYLAAAVMAALAVVVGLIGYLEMIYFLVSAQQDRRRAATGD